MADVAIIYASEDRAVVEALDALLSAHGWSVWWDRHLSGEAFPQEIQRQLVASGCVVVLWSSHSIDKDWVLEEARFAKDQKRALIGARAESVVVPLRFGQDEIVDLVGWEGDASAKGYVRLVQRVERAVGPPKKAWDGKRKLAINVNEKQLALPAFFPSVSSHETQLQPDAGVRALELMESSVILVSAYDLATKKYGQEMSKPLRRLWKRGSVVMLDSGNYEAYRKSDEEWNKTKFREVLKTASFDYAFCYDNLKPPSGVGQNVRDVVSRVRRDQSFSKSGRVMPIVHIPTRKGQFNTAVAPDLFLGISEALNPDVIAVPERELGGGVIEKARVIYAIRQALNEMGRYQPIHLLGTGNPLSFAIFAAAGADTFDGLEWCRTCADHETALLYHFQQYDFFRQQTRSATSRVVRAAADDANISYSARVAFHNLEFFRVWVSDLQKDIAYGRINRLLRDFLPKGFFRELSDALPGAFEQ